MNAEARLGGLRRRLGEEDVVALLVSDASDQRWVTGFDGVFDDDPGTAVLVTEHAARVYADSRYVTAVRAAAAGTEWQIHETGAPAKDALDAAAVDHASGAIALQESLPWGTYTRLAEPYGRRAVPERGWLRALRMVKDAAEIERIARAQEITDRAFTQVLELVRPGITERELALELEVIMRRDGSEGVAFPPIVASGPNSALPHAQPSDRVLAEGDFVKMDFGARVGGYCADMTRTVVLGTASDRQRAIYEAVAAANEAAAAAVRPFAEGPAVHAAAAEVLAAAGFGEYFGHGLGHGVGLDVHEGPGLSPRSTDTLASGMVVTVEPGVYVPGLGGVRIEDLVVVDDSGHRVLTSSTRQLMEIQGR